MGKSYLYALASVPQLGVIERARLRAVGVRPTFEKDDDGRLDGQKVSLRFDAETETEVSARLRRALGSEARLASQVCRMALPEMDGLTSD